MKTRISSNFKKAALAVALCMVFLGLAVLLWASAFYLAERTCVNYNVFDFLAYICGFCGFLSCCIFSQPDENDRND